MPDRILAVRSDNVGDVLLTEPALRALAHDGEVTLLCSPTGRAAADLIGAVSATIVHDCPWIAAEPPPADARGIDELVAAIRALAPDRAVIFTSDRQSPLPMALVLRLADVPVIAARSDQYPGSLLDVRLRGNPEVHEVERNLELVEVLGVAPPFDRRVRVRTTGALPAHVPAGAVVVHPGASVPARTLPVDRWAEVVDALAAEGHPVVLTGGADDAAAGALRARRSVAVDLVGSTSLAQLADVLAAASAVCVGNTGPMHLAAAVGTPVVACFPATVPVERWRPWMVDHVVLGDHDVGCAPCYQRACPVPGNPCADISAAVVVGAVGSLVGRAPALVGVEA